MSPRVSWSAERRWGVGLLAGAVVGLTALVLSASADGLVYYRTPTEAVAAPSSDGTLRVAGLVVAGTLERGDDVSEFVVTDGATQLHVRYEGRLPPLVQEGEGAVVEGRLGADGTIAATEVLLRHSNEYGPAEGDDP